MYKKIIFIFIIFFSFLNINTKVFSENAEVIKIESLKTKKLKIIGFTKFIILDSSIAKIEKLGDELLITGLKGGTTPLYVWKGTQLYPYIIKTIINKEAFLLNFYKKNIKLDELSFGEYTLNNYVPYSINDKSIKIADFRHILNFKSQLFDGNYYFVSTLSNKLDKFTQLKDIILDDLFFSYSNKQIKLDLGDITSNSSNLIPSNYLLRGAKINYNLDKNRNINLFLGVEKQPLFLFGESSQKKEPYFLIGGSQDYIFDKTFQFSALTTSLFSKEQNKTDLNLGLNWNPFKYLVFKSSFGTNFLDFNNFSNLFYRYEWEKTKEWAEFFLEYKKIPKDFFFKNFYDRNIFSINLKSFHISNILVYLRNEVQKQDSIVKNTFSTNFSKAITNKFYMGAGLNLSKYNDDNYINGIQINSSISHFLPITLSYNYSYGYEYSNFISQQFNSYIDIFNGFGTNIFLNTSFYNRKDNISNTIKNMSNFDINLNSLFSITNDFSINSKISYKFNEEKFNQKRESKDISFSLEGHYKIIPLHQINFSFAINNSFYNDKSENININFFSGYSYYFGELINNQLKEGNIKGVVYEDENNNNYYDNGEKIFSGIKIDLKDKKEISNKNGFNFSNLPYSSYEISVDKKTLPKGYNITSSSSEIINLYEKNKSVNFAISNKIPLRGIVYRNKNRFGGLDSIRVILDNKYEVETDLDGTFSFRTELGKHTLKLDIASIPKNYSPFNGIIKNIDINNDNNNNLEFILYPIRTFKANILDTLRSRNLIINEVFNIKYIYDDKIIEKKIKTNDLGQLYIKDLDECYLEISHNRMKDPLKIKIEDYPQKIKSEIYLY